MGTPGKGGGITMPIIQMPGVRGGACLGLGGRHECTGGGVSEK